MCLIVFCNAVFSQSTSKICTLIRFTLFSNESDIVKTLSAQELHKCLLVALAELTDLERLIIDEVFFSPDKRPSLEELGNKHNISRQAYSRKLNRTLHKLRILIEQDITEY